MEDRIKNVMGSILTIDPESIDENSSMDTINFWDSLAQINLVFALEKEFGLNLSVDEIVTMTSYRGIVGVVAGHL